MSSAVFTAARSEDSASCSEEPVRLSAWEPED